MTRKKKRLLYSRGTNTKIAPYFSRPIVLYFYITNIFAFRSVPPGTRSFRTNVAGLTDRGLVGKRTNKIVRSTFYPYSWVLALR